jgi:mono/diheme cytochrome c family protein
MRATTLALATAALFAAGAARADGDPGEAVFKESCSGCHGPKSKPLDAVRLTREKWKDQVERMEGLGAEIPSGKKLEALLDWLAKTHGPAPAQAPEAK